ncbi:3'-5' exonuclease [Sulfurimonas sp. MAG313]|nr:3'-5' exonuclease [Sulfurimonas sp. MAG313]MDF1880271.1 3'-5' exonuclease [Sulfurimonas sp. MAG313]
MPVNKIIILDTETTGVLEEDRIIQLSYIVTDAQGKIEEVHNEFCEAPLAIKFDAMAIHHITPEELVGKPACTELLGYKRLHELNTPDNLIVIQSAEFDLGMLSKEGFESKMQLIDTFRIHRFFFHDDAHGLQYNRYANGLYKKEAAQMKELGVEIAAHDALGDVIVLKNFYDYLLEHEDAPDESKMIEMCSKPILMDVMPFGKHKGKRIEEVAVSERRSLSYMLDTFDLDQDLKYSFQYYYDLMKDKASLVIGFGKYKGKAPADVVGEDRSYLEWMANKAENIMPELKTEIKRVLELPV